MYTPKLLRKALLSMIRSLGRHPERFARRPGRDFTRKRALTFETLIFLLLTMSEKSIGKDLIKQFRRKADAPSASAFVQQRQELLPAALEELYHRFTAFLQPPGVQLPNQPEFDLSIRLALGRLTRRQPEQRGLSVPKPYYRVPNGVTFDFPEPGSDEFYRFPVRVVRLRVGDGRFVTLLTNLDAAQFPPALLKQLYARRWGIETSFRSLKYTVGMVYLHAKKPELILQEIFACFILYNFAQAVAWGVDTSKGRSKHKRHVNFSDAMELCCAFLRKPVGDLYALLVRNLIPYRPDRSFPRPKIADNRIAFSYRPAR